jgi:hypothetical protein
MHVPLPDPVPKRVPEPIPRIIWRFRNEGVEAFNTTVSKRFCVLCVVCCVLFEVLSCLVLSVTPTVHYRKAAIYDAAKTNLPAN